MLRHFIQFKAGPKLSSAMDGIDSLFFVIVKERYKIWMHIYASLKN